MLIDASTDPDGCDQFADGTPAYLNGNIAQTTFSYDSRLSVALNNSYGSISYDRLGRLKSATSATNAAYHVGTSPALTYDANGNILTMQRGSSPSAVNYNYAPNTNKIASVGANVYQHDLNGNMTVSPKASMTYDPFTQMTTELVPTTGGAVKLHYNAADERVLKTQGNQATLYLHGLSDYPLVEKSDNGGSFFETRYVYGLGGLIATQRGGQLNFIFKDHLGSTRVVASADGTSGIGYSYDALGNVVQQSAFGNPTSAIAYQYTGQEFDSETQLHNFRARLYDSELFRFYATDPAGQQHSPYSFVGNSPFLYTDPTGTWFGIDDLIIAGVSFVTSYLSNAIKTGDFGWSSVRSGLISAGTSWLAYNTGGAVGGWLFPTNTVAAGITSSVVGGAVGGFTGSVGGQLATTGRVDWSKVGQSVVAGVGGGFAGGISGQFIGDPILPSMIGGAVGGGIQGAYDGDGFGGATRGAIFSAFSAGLTNEAYKAYGRILTDRLQKDAFETDVSREVIGAEQRKELGIQFDPDEYSCGDFVTDMTSLSLIDPSNRIVGFNSNPEFPHLGIDIGGNILGQRFILSKLGANFPIRVETATSLSIGSWLKSGFYYKGRYFSPSSGAYGTWRYQ